MARVYEHVRTAGPLVFVAGQTPQSPTGEVPDAVAEQVRIVIAKIASLLAEHDAGLADVVRVTYFLTDVRDLAVVRSALDELLPHPRPAATLVEVSGLIDPRYRVEVDAIAYREA
jgi:enamine deaminase RidA (YjgF/YER057c/UK114 family)